MTGNDVIHRSDRLLDGCPFLRKDRRRAAGPDEPRHIAQTAVDHRIARTLMLETDHIRQAAIHAFAPRPNAPDANRTTRR